MTATGADVLGNAATILQDDDHVRWPLAELAGWINDGLRAIVLAKPSASSQTVVLSLVAGTLQSLTSADHLQLLRVTRNITAEGPPRVAGRAIRLVDRELLDTSAANWHDAIEVPFKTEVRQYTYDEAVPREFYVYPGNDGNGKVEAAVSTMPALLAASGDPDAVASYNAAIGLAEPYVVPLLDYVLFRAFSKDDVAGNAGQAATHYQAFATALGIKIQNARAYSPNTAQKVEAK